jgi:hypothetical protein
MSFGIDLSHHQTPASVPWVELGALHDSFVICRSSYGTLKDRQLVEHVKRARKAGVRVGLYHFLRISQPIADQMATIRAQAEACGYGPGDICPWLDIELDPLPEARKVEPSWSGPAFELLSSMREAFGVAGVYITQADWHSLGKPGWVLDAPIWCAHWTGAAKPATPGGVGYALWQHRVGLFDPNGPGGSFQTGPGLILDQNRSVEPLPLCSRAPGVSPLLPPPSESEDDPEWDELLFRAQVAAFERAAEIGQNAVSDGLREMSGSDDLAPDTVRDAPQSKSDS